MVKHQLKGRILDSIFKFQLNALYRYYTLLPIKRIQNLDKNIIKFKEIALKATEKNISYLTHQEHIPKNVMKTPVKTILKNLLSYGTSFILRLCTFLKTFLDLSCMCASIFKYGTIPNIFWHKK